MAINYKLKILRAEHNLSQKTLAKILNITVSTYSRKENGERNFTIEEAQKLATIFNTTIESIFFSNKL